MNIQTFSIEGLKEYLESQHFSVKAIKNHGDYLYRCVKPGLKEIEFREIFEGVHTFKICGKRCDSLEKAMEMAGA